MSVVIFFYIDTQQKFSHITAQSRNQHNKKYAGEQNFFFTSNIGGVLYLNIKSAQLRERLKHFLKYNFVGDVLCKQKEGRRVCTIYGHIEFVSSDTRTCNLYLILQKPIVCLWKPFRSILTKIT